MADVDNRKVMTQPEKIDHILNGGCAFFGVPRDVMFKKESPKSKIWHKRKYFTLLLDDNTSCSLRDIADILGYSQHGTVMYHLSKIRDELSSDFYGSKKTKMIYNELLSYLNL